jgi:hypothetical protein
LEVDDDGGDGVVTPGLVFPTCTVPWSMCSSVALSTCSRWAEASAAPQHAANVQSKKTSTELQRGRGGKGGEYERTGRARVWGGVEGVGWGRGCGVGSRVWGGSWISWGMLLGVRVGARRGRARYERGDGTDGGDGVA